MLPRFKKQHVVAVVEFRELVELVELRLCIELCILATMGQERVEGVEEMAVAVGDAPRAED